MDGASVGIGCDRELTGVVDPHTPGRIAAGIARAGLGNRQPAALGAAARTEPAKRLRLPEAIRRLVGRRAVGCCRRLRALENLAAVDVLQLQRRLLNHRRRRDRTAIALHRLELLSAEAIGTGGGVGQGSITVDTDAVQRRHCQGFLRAVCCGAAAGVVGESERVGRGVVNWNRALILAAGQG